MRLAPSQAFSHRLAHSRSLYPSSFLSPRSLTMATANTPPLDPAAVASFRAHLNSSTRILALLGAGLSASSGLPTVRKPRKHPIPFPLSFSHWPDAHSIQGVCSMRAALLIGTPTVLGFTASSSFLQRGPFFQLTWVSSSAAPAAYGAPTPPPPSPHRPPSAPTPPSSGNSTPTGATWP